ncbi:hypothetical protein SNE40_019602 [Patella caerulea]|uniref:CS domain-containing protein n=1 Tax=Patella caerulea TaxID=87958 RepID=A0AAN8J6S2_PATCE
MAGMDDKYDSALLGILQNEGNISSFLQVMFGFLFRRTDFYITMTSEKDKMGFPPGAQVKLLLQAHKHYEKLAAEREKRKNLSKSEKNDKPAASSESEKETTVKSTTIENPATSSLDTDINMTPEIKQQEIVQPESKISSKNVPSQSKTENVPSQSKSQNVPSQSKTESEKSSDTNEEEDPEVIRQQKIFQANPESYNGAVRENYSWSQSITDVDVRVNVPKAICKGNQVHVVTDKKHLKVGYKDCNGDIQIVVDGDLTWEVHKEESIWSLVPGEHVHINLEKKQERWWEGLFVNEPKINVRKIDCSRPMTELDDEAQAKIGEMMFNEQQKRLGLPQSHEQKTYDMMKQAWDAEGSPFKGQPFDPSKFNVNSGGVVSIND